MTSIAAWVGVDSRAVASLYIVSDSRISWGLEENWDQGRKVFACIKEPHLFGYYGDVLFPALVIPAIVDRIDRGLLNGSPRGWGRNIQESLRRLASDYPSARRRNFGILHGYRDGERMDSRFHLEVITYDASRDKWSTITPAMPSVSSFLHIAGSGARSVKEIDILWQEGPEKNTSRAVYSAFHESVASGGDSKTGGAPQLGGIYRVGPARLIGIVLDNQRYFAGAPLVGYEDSSAIEWRNELFERMDGKRRKPIPVAQRHRSRTQTSS